MPTLAPAARLMQATTMRGFTLLEVLVVVVLVGVMSGIALMGLGGGSEERRLRDESQRLAALITQAGSEAVMQNREFGLRLTANGYEFLCLDEAAQRWRACVDESAWRAHELPAGMSVDLLQDSTLELPLAKTDEKADAKAADGSEGERGPRLYPDILLLSSGEASPASLELRLEDAPQSRLEVRIDELGRVQRLDADGNPLDADRHRDEGGKSDAPS